MLLPLFALLALPAITSGEPTIPPRPLPVIAAVLATALLAALGGNRGPGGHRPRYWLDLPVAAGLGLAAGHLLFFPGMPRGHDTLTHLWGIWAVAREARAGHWMSPWLHRLGLGMPLLRFYGPLSFLVLLPLMLAGPGTAEIFKIGLAAFGALAAVTMYTAVARWTDDRRAALVAAAAWAFAPYRLLDTQYRTALGESLALALLPLVLLLGMEAVWRNGPGSRRRIALAVLPAALLVICHPISVLMTGIGMGIWILAGSLPLRRPGVLIDRLGTLAMIWLAAGALAGFFVVPFAVEVGNLELGGVAHGNAAPWFALHAVHPDELVARRLWSELRLSELAGTEADQARREMPFYFGVVLLSLLPLAAGLGRFPGEGAGENVDERPGPPPGLVWMVLAMLALTTGPVAGAVAAVFPLVAALQFPWRFLGLASCGAAVAAGLAAARLLRACGDGGGGPPRGRRLAWLARLALVIPGALVALLAVDAFPYMGAADWFPSWQRLGHIVFHPACGRAWGCSDLEPVDPPYPLRAAGSFVPPDELGGPDVSLFCCPYPEYATPASRRSFGDARNRDVLARAGVGLVAEHSHPLERLPARPYAQWRQPGSGQRGLPLPFVRAGGSIVVRSTAHGQAGRVVVLEQYFPGWQVLTPGGWREVTPTRTGLLQGDLAAGQRELRFRLSRWRPEQISGRVLSLLTLAGLALAARRGRPRTEARPPSRE